MKKESHGYYGYRYNDDSGVLVCVRKDKQTVTIATTFDSVGRGNRMPSKMFTTYNKVIGRVLMDQMISVYRTRMRQRKWYWPIFSYLLDASKNNIWHLMKKGKPNDQKCSSLLNFRTEISKSPLEMYGTEKKPHESNSCFHGY